MSISGISFLATSTATAAAEPRFSVPRPQSAARALTPTRTGLTGRALRVPSRLANTPGAVGVDGTNPQPTKFKGILKKLQFSAVTIESTGPLYDPATTTKRLQFEGVQETPLGSSLPGTFGADTASPAHSRPGKPYSTLFQTPEAIFEGESGEESEEEVANGTVNSRNAGATPFDRRLSALFAKYSDGESGDDGVEHPSQQQKQEQETPDLWKRLSAVPATQSIKALAETLDATATKGNPEAMSVAGNTHIKVLNSPLFASNAAIITSGSETAGKEELQHKEENAVQVVEEESQEKTTPNGSIASILGVLLRRSLEDIAASKVAEASAEKRYLLSGAVSPTTGVLSVLPAAPPSVFANRGQTQTLAQFQQAQEDENSEDDMVLEDSDSESENDEGLVGGAGPNAVRNMGMLTPVLDAGAASDIDLSPAPASATASEASFMSASTPLLCYDGVIRDAQRVPLVTPGTVTMFRGAAAPMREDGIAADLYRSFTTPETPYEADEEAEEEKDADEEYSPVLAGRALELPAEAEEEELLGANNNNDEVHGNNLLPQAQQQEQEEEEAATSPGEESFGFDFSFRPSLAPPPQVAPTSAISRRSSMSMSGSDGTPDFQPKTGTAKTGRHGTPRLSLSLTPSVDMPQAPMSVEKQQQQQQQLFGELTPVAAAISISSLGNANAAQRMSLSSPSVSLAPAPSLTKDVRGLMRDMSLNALPPPPCVPAPGPAVVTRSPAKPSPHKPGKKDSRLSLASNGMPSASALRRSPRLSTAAENSTGISAQRLQASAENVEKKKPRNRRLTLTPAAAINTPINGGSGSDGVVVTPTLHYSLRSASKPLTNAKKPSPGSSDKALKLSPTEQDIRNTLRRSSRRKSTLGPAN